MVNEFPRVGLLLCAVGILGSAAAHSQAPASSAPATSTGQTTTGTIGNPTSGQTNRQGAQTPTATNPNRRATADDAQNDKNKAAEATRDVSALPPEPPTEFQKLVSSLSGKDVPIFGASIFSSAPSTFAPVDQIPVPSNYVVGPGDELQIQIYGQINQSGRYIVDRSGSIAVPEVGPVHVAGLQYSQLTQALKDQLSRIYRNFDLTVQMGQLRSIQIFALGEVRHPGSFTVSSLSTLVNALFASGGPSANGSLRRIQLRRNGQPAREFDLYDLLIRGDKSKDISLLPGDVIFVPPVGPQVALLGSVNQNGVYEIKDEKDLNDVLKLAGGLITTASTQSVRIERIVGHQALIVNQASLTPEGRLTPIQDGDILTFPSIQDRFRNAITLRGNVANPGRYIWHEGMTVKDLIPNKDSLVTANYWLNHNNLGITTNRDYEAIQEGALGASTRTTEQGSVQATSSITDAQSATSSSFAARNDIILSAADIDWGYAVVERLNADTLVTSLIPFNLGKLILDGDMSQNVTLRAGDVITIFSTADIEVPQSQRTRFVRLEGEIVSAGVYSVNPGETLAEVIARAGGLTNDAYLFGATFTRQSTKRLQQQRLNEYTQQLRSQLQQAEINDASKSISAQDATIAAASQAAAEASIQRLATVEASGRIVLGIPPEARGLAAVPYVALEDGDRFVVPRLPSEVNIQGAVYNQNAVLYARGVRAGAYLRAAGGPTRDGDPKKEFIVRADGSLLSRQYLSEHQFNDARIYPGDTVVIPERIDKQSALRTLVYLAQIVGQFGLGAAAINVLR
jgi:protein involved in polysaccharide export with SLBB domain